MLSYGSRWSTVTTTAEALDRSSERRVRRLRLTLHPSDNSSKQDGTCKSGTDTQGKTASSLSNKKTINYAQRERPVGAELSAESGVADGMVECSSSLARGPKLYAVVQRKGADSQQEVMAYEWSINHLRDEMNYIREVRESLEKVRERMYGQFDGMQQSMHKLSQQIKTTNSKKWSLETEVRKPLPHQSTNRIEMRSQVRALQSSFEQTEERLRDMEKQLATAQEENHTLRLQVESSQEANSQALQDLTQRLQSQYEAQLREEQQKHKQEIKALQTQLDVCMKKIEELEMKAKVAEAQIAEKDKRISEVERLLNCMVQEKSQLERKLQESEQLLHRLHQAEQADTAAKLAQEAADLRERIKHLNDMVFSQQRKVKGLVMEVEALKAKVAQKDLYITELLERIAFVECENNELQDKLKYYMSMQNVTSDGAVSTRDIGVGCDVLLSPEIRQQEECQSRPDNNLPTMPGQVDLTLSQ
ncbi:myocardial zonula adherens protein-like isoform X1 [Arapaima gigas]